MEFHGDFRLSESFCASFGGNFMIAPVAVYESRSLLNE